MTTGDNIQHTEAMDKRVEHLMRRQWDLVGQPSVGHEVEERLWKQIRRNTTLNRRSILTALTWRIAAVAAVLLLMVGGGWWLAGQREVSAPLDKEAVRTYYAVQNHSFILPDSSVVWMKEGSTIRYASNFLTNRSVWLEGESVFDVKKMDGVPFRVFAGTTCVEVKGTVFQVIHNDSTAVSEVTLYRGAVDFTASSGAQPVQMKPGQRALYEAAHNRVVVKNIAMIEWQNGRYHFTDQPILDLLCTVSDLYRVEVRLSHNLSSHYRFNGYIRYDETLEEVLEKICYNTNLSYKQQGNIFVIYKWDTIQAVRTCLDKCPNLFGQLSGLVGQPFVFLTSQPFSVLPVASDRHQ